MASHRNAASRPSSGEGRASAEALPLGDEPLNEKTPGDSAPPRAGRTGNRGAKAERPADGRARKSSSGAEPRGEKPPSPAAKKNPRGADATQPPREPGA